MRGVIVVGLGAFIAGAAVAAPAVAQERRAPPAVLSAAELTSIRSLVTGTPQWSPDGSRLLFGSPLAGSDLWTVAWTGGPPVALGIRMQASFFFVPPAPTYSPDGRWIAYVSNRSGAAELYVHSLEDGREVQLTRMGARINSYAWSPDGQAIAFAGDRYGNYDIYRVAVPSGTVARLTRDGLNEVTPAWTPDGTQLVFVQLDVPWLEHTVYVLRADGQGTPREVVRDTNFFDYQEGLKFGPPRVSPDGSTLLFRSYRSGWLNYWVVPMRGGAPRQIAPEAADQSAARWSPDGTEILYLALWNGLQDLRTVSATGGQPRVLVKPVGLGFVASPAWSPDGSHVSYTFATPVAPADLYVIPSKGGLPIRLTTSGGPAYRETSLIVPRKVEYPSTDGPKIAGYLFDPILAAGEKAPGILLIHGGPTAQFSDSYQEQAQFFAMHGYAVLLPNVRGSSGYGRAFEDLNRGCWCRCDLKDVLAGVEFLKTQRYIQPTRMGITGTSGGGIMSLCAVAFAPGAFQAAIPQSGYGDWVHFYDEEELRHIKLVLYELGPMPQSIDLYRYLSPINYIDSIQTPIFLIQGEGKPGLPKADDFHIFADRLEMRYKPYRYKIYPNEWYYVRDPANVRVMLGDMLEFFDQYLKDGAAAKETHVASH